MKLDDRRRANKLFGACVGWLDRTRTCPSEQNKSKLSSVAARLDEFVTAYPEEFPPEYPKVVRRAKALVRQKEIE
jgi:hypothetical protein